MKRSNHLPALLTLGLGAVFSGCTPDGGGAGVGEDPRGPAAVRGFSHEVDTQIQLNLGTQRTYPQGNGVRQGAASIPTDDLRVDYAMALRTAAVKLRGNLPTMAEIDRLQKAIAIGAHDGKEGDPAFVYKDLIQKYMTEPTFARQMMHYWRNTLRMGPFTTTRGTNKFNGIAGTFQDKGMERFVNIDTAPALLARLVVEGKDMRLAFTNTSTQSGIGNCPTFNAANNTFVNNNCFVAGVSMTAPPDFPGNNVPEADQAGVLTNPGFQAQFYGNMAYRRVRAIQEIFACSKMPAEFAAATQQVNGYNYFSPWPLNSIPADNTTRPTLAARRYPIAGATPNQDFVAFDPGCQNCHATMNHQAALFATFDSVGFSSQDTSRLMVMTPVAPTPYTQLAEFFPATDKPAWRYGKPTLTIQAFGQAMASDPEVHRCFVTRMWNWAYSRDDVVNELAIVPSSVTADLVKHFTDNNFNMKATLLRLMTDGNFIRY